MAPRSHEPVHDWRQPVTASEVVRAYLLTLAPVTALVNARVWTFRLPAKPTLPAVLVQQISHIQSPHLRGTDGLYLARVQVDVVAETVGAARELDAAILGDYVSGVPTGLRGIVADVGSPPVHIRQALADGYRELFDADELKQARVSRDYRIWLN